MFLLKTFKTAQGLLDAKYRKDAVAFHKKNERETCYQNRHIFNPDVFNSGITSKKRKKMEKRRTEVFKLIRANGSSRQQVENNWN